MWLARTTSAIGCTALRFSAKYPKWTREPTLILSWCVTNKLNVHRSCDNVSVCTFSSTQSPIRSSPIKAECERMIFPWGLRISPADPVAESLVMTHVKSWCVKIIVNHAAWYYRVWLIWIIERFYEHARNHDLHRRCINKLVLIMTYWTQNSVVCHCNSPQAFR